ncbi:MAG: hypothetical protein AAFV62_11665 [Pseudomonadota bacterium]
MRNYIMAGVAVVAIGGVVAGAVAHGEYRRGYHGDGHYGGYDADGHHRGGWHGEAMGKGRGDGRRGRGARMIERFEEMDQNADGSVTAAEVWMFQTQRFEAADKNSDGSLDRDELIEAAQDRTRERFERRVDRRLSWMDTDGDGALSLAETGQSGRRLMRMDRDGDGAVSRGELERMLHRRMKR